MDHNTLIFMAIFYDEDKGTTNTSQLLTSQYSVTSQMTWIISNSDTKTSNLA